MLHAECYCHKLSPFITLGLRLMVTTVHDAMNWVNILYLGIDSDFVWKGQLLEALCSVSCDLQNKISFCLDKRIFISCMSDIKMLLIN